MQGLKWAIAGRSAEKLSGIKAKLGVSLAEQYPGIVVADGDNAASVDAMTKQSRYETLQ